MIIKKILRSRKLHLLAFLLVLLTIAGCVPGTTVPRGWSGGAIADGTLFIGSVDGKIVAVNASDGRRIWEAALETTAPPSGGFGCAAPPTSVAIYGSPAVSDNLVYIGGYTGKFYAFAPGEKEPRWVYPRDGTVGSQIVGGALVAQDKVIFGAANGKVYALNAATGASSNGWIFPSGNNRVGKIWSTPAYLDGTIFIGSFDKNLYALDIATGEKKWAFATQGAIAATPVAYNGTVYIGSFDRNLYAIDATTGKEKWRFSGAKNWFWAKPVIKDNVIYAANLDGKVYVLDAQSGTKLAEFNLGSPVSSSPVLAGNILIVVTESGNITGIDTSKHISSPQIALKLLRNLGEKIDAPLATDGVAVFIHTGTGKLYAVNAQSGAEVWPYISLKGN